MKILIAGLGSIGRRHLDNARRLEPEAEITVLHHGTSERTPRLALPGVREIWDLDEVVTFDPDVAVIASPSPFHVPTALPLARMGIDYLIEKPLSNRVEGVDELLEITRQQKLVAMVAYNFRFYPPLQLAKELVADERLGRIVSARAEVGQYLPDWRPDSDYRQSATARRDLGGGAILELSHELDYLRWLLGKVDSVFALGGRLSDLEVDVEDLAEILLSFEDGTVGSVHVDLLQRPARRELRLIGTQGTLEWCGLTHQLRVSRGEGPWELIHSAREIDRNQMYLDELKEFFRCASVRDEPSPSLEDGAEVLRIALAAQRSLESNRSEEP